MARPSLLRLLAIVFYDGCLLLGILFFATLLALPLHDGEAFQSNGAFTAYILIVSFCFYGWFWTHGGQTLGLRAWKCQVLTSTCQPLSWRQALIRFVTAFFSLACLGLGFFWRLIDKNGRTWHDITSNTGVYLIK
jgi:uncharacterized RDD family membrane protein YckC